MPYSSLRRSRYPLALLATLLLSGSALEAQANNTSTGTGALASITTGIDNSAFGFSALNADTTASANTGLGFDALVKSTTGGSNTAVGYFTLGSLVSGTGNIALGQQSGKAYTGSESNNILIGSVGAAHENNTIRIGGSQTATFISGIDGVTIGGGAAVFINALGQLGTVTSSLRFKEGVRDMGDSSDALMALRPVSFYYKPQYDDGSRLLQYGLIAEEVAKVNPGLVQYDKDGKPLAVRYQFVNAMLLNEVQKQHQAIEDLQRQVQELLAQRQPPSSR